MAAVATHTHRGVLQPWTTALWSSLQAVQAIKQSCWDTWNQKYGFREILLQFAVQLSKWHIKLSWNNHSNQLQLHGMEFVQCINSLDLCLRPLCVILYSLTLNSVVTMSSARLFAADADGELWELLDLSGDGTSHRPRHLQSSRSRSREQHRKDIVAWFLFVSLILIWCCLWWLWCIQASGVVTNLHIHTMWLHWVLESRVTIYYPVLPFCFSWFLLRYTNDFLFLSWLGNQLSLQHTVDWEAFHLQQFGHHRPIMWHPLLEKL